MMDVSKVIGSSRHNRTDARMTSQRLCRHVSDLEKFKKDGIWALRCGHRSTNLEVICSSYPLAKENQFSSMGLIGYISHTSG